MGHRAVCSSLNSPYKLETIPSIKGYIEREECEVVSKLVGTVLNLGDEKPVVYFVHSSNFIG